MKIILIILTVFASGCGNYIKPQHVNPTMQAIIKSCIDAGASAYVRSYDTSLEITCKWTR